MPTIGFPISHKENEFRRSLLPSSLQQLEHPECCYIESGYGEILGFSDIEYEQNGGKVVSRDCVLKQAIICDPKVGDADYLSALHNQTVFGWVHATQNRSITDLLVEGNLTAFAWEKMFEHGRHIFWRNNELAGEAAVLHAFQCFGQMPYESTVAVIGNGNTARGAMRVLNMLGATVLQYNRHTEELLRVEIGAYDVIVNCVLWDIRRKDHIISRQDLKRMKKNAMIIDVSCDRHGGIETSVPTTFQNPIYTVDGILHYAVDHTPSIFYKTFSKNNAETIIPYLNQLLSENYSPELRKAQIIENGNIVDPEIISFQQRI